MADEHLISLQPGTVIAGRYEVVKCLGAGSMGIVYACRHRELVGHLVAIKVLFPEVAQDKIAAARFRNEIFASYGVSHPNVVRAYEYLRDGDLVAYTMEYVDGGALADRLEHPEERMPVQEVISILSQMCSGVQAIHDAGIVHRDLKPENILLTKEGAVKIADFGIARTGHGPRLTEHGGVVGTIDYVSPEYMLNSQVDWRSDIYAIGILGYEMVTGESPFRGESVYATMTKRLKSDAKPPSVLRPECPARLDQIILKAMHRDPEGRYQSAVEMLHELQSLSGSPLGLPGSPARDGGEAARRAGGPVYQPAAGSLRESGAGRAGAASGSSRGYQAVDYSSSNSGYGWDDEPGAASAGQDYNVVDTQVIDREYKPAIDSTVEVDTIHEPIRMERVLAYKDMVSGSWDASPLPSEVSISSGGLDEQRIRRLSRMAETVHTSIWVDIVISVVAIFIGVGVGFALLRMVFPGMGQGTPAGAVTQMESVEAR